MHTAATAIASRKALYESAYCWYVLVCVLDLMFTYIVLFRLGGVEVNGIAHHAIRLGGFWGLITLKVATMFVVIAACEAIGARKPLVGKRVSEWAVALSAIPVVVGGAQVAAFVVKQMA